MPFSELRDKGFFADKNRAFWLLQGGGWGAYFLLRTLGGLANRMGLTFILPTIIVTATGFSLTLLMAAAYRRVIRMRAVFVWTLTLFIVALAPPCSRCSRSGRTRPSTNPGGSLSASSSSARSCSTARCSARGAGCISGSTIT